MQLQTNDKYNLVTAPVLVTGGTGRLGRLVVPRLREAGHQVRVLSRHNHETKDGIKHVIGNLLTGEGVESALVGAETIVHLAGAPNAKGDDEATRNLVRAASRAGVRHLVYISVIGADRMPLSYFRSKLGAELAVADSGLPWTTLRSAQVHDLVLTLVRGMAKLPVIPIPGGLRFQPVDPEEVAARIVELTLDKPAGLVPDLAEGVRDSGSDPWIPAGNRQAPGHDAGPDTRKGRSRVPSRRESVPRWGRPGQADLGGLPGRAAEFPHRSVAITSRSTSQCQPSVNGRSPTDTASGLSPPASGASECRCANLALWQFQRGMTSAAQWRLPSSTAFWEPVGCWSRWPRRRSLNMTQT